MKTTKSYELTNNGERIEIMQPPYTYPDTRFYLTETCGHFLAYHGGDIIVISADKETALTETCNRIYEIHKRDFVQSDISLENLHYIRCEV